MSVNTYDKILTKGPESALPSVENGKLRFTTDTGRLFIDGNNTRVEVTDFVKGMTEAEIKALLAPLVSKIYISSDTDKMMYYDTTSGWTEINSAEADYAASAGTATYANTAGEVAYTAITYQQWQNMTPQERAAHDYFIADYPGAGIVANQIPYDNTVSGLESAEVQSAIDEVNSNHIEYKNQNDLNLEVPNRKNILPLYLNDIKKFTNYGTWNSNNVLIAGITYTFTVNSEGIVTKIHAEGTSTADAWLVLNADNIDFSNCILSGCPSNGSVESYVLAAFKNSPNTWYYDTGNGADIPQNTIINQVYFNISEGYTVPSGGLDIYPMIRPSWITDSTFEPYIPSVETRLENVKNESKLNTQDLTTPSRTKNLLPVTISIIKSTNTGGTWSENTYTYNGVTVTIITDANDNVLGINFDGKPASGVFQFGIPFKLSVDKYLFNGIPLTSGSFDNFRADIRYSIGGTVYEYSSSDTGDGGEVDIQSEITLYYNIRINSTYTANNVLVKPMIYKENNNSDFEPYIPSVNSRIDEINSNLTTLIKSDTVTLTTGINGHAETTIPDTVKVLHVTSNGAPCLAFTYHGYWFFDVLTWDASTLQLALKPSAETTFTYYYVE